jgi:hypothetical protein
MSKRVRLRAKMFDHVRRWENSGLSQRAYCERAKINRAVFYYWVKIQREAPKEDQPSNLFLPVVINESMPEDVDQKIVVNCPNGLVITFPNMPGSIALIRQLITG